MPIESYAKELIKVQYADTHDLLHHLETTPAVWPSQKLASRTVNPDHSWTLGVRYDEAVRMLHDGWEEGVQKIAALAQPVPNANRFVEKPDFAGERPDIQRYLAGDMRSMIRRGAARKPRPTMSIVVSIGANCMVQARSMWNYGAAMVSLIDRLESKGVRVEVQALWVTQTRTARTCLSVGLKRAEDALDISTLAFSLSHPAMLRRLMFAALERTRQPYDSAYGRSLSIVYETDMVNPTAGALYIGGIGSSGDACYTVSDALEYAKGQINRAAGNAIVELEEAV
jgi:hypothetical protein